MKEINVFKGKNYFLSNMFPTTVTFEGQTYLCVESAFQAAKCVNPVDREEFTSLDGYSAKKLGRRVNLRKDWENIKLDVMTACVRDKFTSNPVLRNKLIATDNAILIEGNTWNDTFWGVCNGTGKNHLGQILMQIRSELQNEK